MTTENRQEFTIHDLESFIRTHGENILDLQCHPAQVDAEFPFPEHISFRQSEGLFFSLYALVLPNGDILEYASDEGDIRTTGLVFTQREYRLWVAQEYPEEHPTVTFDEWLAKHPELEDQIPEGL